MDGDLLCGEARGSAVNAVVISSAAAQRLSIRPKSLSKALLLITLASIGHRSCKYLEPRAPQRVALFVP
jgi:hypothetical protein